MASEKLILRQTGKYKGEKGGNEANNYALVDWEYIRPAQPLAQSDTTLGSEETNPLGQSNPVLKTHQERTDKGSSTRRKTLGSVDRVTPAAKAGVTVPDQGEAGEVEL